MYYLIQENIFREPTYDQIFEAVNELGLAHEIISFRESKTEIRVQTKRKDIFVFGSILLARLATQYGWKPGSFYGGNHNFEVYSQHYGEHLLNAGSLVCKFTDDLGWQANEQKFIKPSKDSKAFTGKVFTQLKWEDFVQNQLFDVKNPYLTPETLIQVAKPTYLFKEARVWIVNGKVITSSYYKFHGLTEFEVELPREGVDFAQKMAEQYQVAPAFVMDIAHTIEGWKIVEVNCVNSAGFYKGNLVELLKALEKIDL